MPFLKSNVRALNGLREAFRWDATDKTCGAMENQLGVDSKRFTSQLFPGS
jgi:hypothetical protein